jgi:hypothetical protein
MAVGGSFLKGPRALELPVSALQTLGKNPMLSAPVSSPSPRLSSLSSHKMDMFSVTETKWLRPERPAVPAIPGFPEDWLASTACPSSQFGPALRSQPFETTRQSNTLTNAKARIC